MTITNAWVIWCYKCGDYLYNELARCRCGGYTDAVPVRVEVK